MSSIDKRYIIFNIYCKPCFDGLQLSLKAINIFSHAPCMHGTCMGCQEKIKGNNLVMFKYKP